MRPVLHRAPHFPVPCREESKERRKQIYSCIKYELHDNFLRKLRLLSIAFSKILLIWQGAYDMECHIRIFFVHKYLRDILRFYAQRSDPCLIERITPVGIFGFTIKLDSGYPIPHPEAASHKGECWCSPYFAAP